MAEGDRQGFRRGDNIRQARITRLFILVCIAVLCASYGVGLGVRRIRGVDKQAPVVAAADSDIPTDEPEPDVDEVAAETEPGSEMPEESVEEPHEEPVQEVAARPERVGGGGAQMVVVEPERIRAMREQLQRMTVEEAERKELQARRARQDEKNVKLLEEAWPSLDEETREKIRGIIERWPNMSEEERDYHRAGNID